MSVFSWNKESHAFLCIETRKLKFDFEQVALSIRNHFGISAYDISPDECRINYAEEYLSQFAVEDFEPPILDIDDSMTFEEIMNVVEIRNERSDQKKRKIFSRVLASLGNPDDTGKLEDSTDMEKIKSNRAERKKLKDFESDRKERHVLEQKEIRWFENEREKLRDRHLPGSIDAEGEGEFPYPISRSAQFPLFKSALEAEGKERSLARVTERSIAFDREIGEVFDGEEEIEGGELDAALPADYVYHFDTEDLFGSPDLDALLEQIEKELDARAEGKEDAEGASSELFEVLNFLDQSIAGRKNVFRTSVSSSRVSTSHTAASVHIEGELVEKIGVNKEVMNHGEKPFNGMQSVVIREMKVEEENLLSGELPFSSPSVVSMAVKTTEGYPAILSFQASPDGSSEQSAASADVAVALSGSITSMRDRSGGRGSSNCQTRAAAAAAAVATLSPTEEQDTDDKYDDDDAEDWRSVRHIIKNRASHYIPSSVPVPTYAPTPAPLSTTLTPEISSSSSGARHGVASSQILVSTTHVISSDDDGSNTLETLAAEGIDLIEEYVSISGTGIAVVVADEQLIEALTSSSASPSDTATTPYVLPSTTATAIASVSVTGADDMPATYANSFNPESQQHGSSSRPGLGSGSLSIRRSATGERKKIVPRVLLQSIPISVQPQVPVSVSAVATTPS